VGERARTFAPSITKEKDMTKRIAAERTYLCYSELEPKRARARGTYTYSSIYEIRNYIILHFVVFLCFLSTSLLVRPPALNFSISRNFAEHDCNNMDAPCPGRYSDAVANWVLTVTWSPICLVQGIGCRVFRTSTTLASH